MIINIRDIYNHNLTINEFFALLKLYCIEKDIESDIHLHHHSDILFTSLETNNYIKIFNNKPVMRAKGDNLIEELVSFSSKVKPKAVQTPFDEFWTTYPNTDKHSVYLKTRTLKSNKAGCKKKYIEYLKSGVKHSDILKALKYEIKERKQLSSNDNKLSYMQNSYTWLNQKTFEIILETINEDQHDDDWTSNTV